MKTISDPTLLSEVRRYGRFDVDACYNCGSCAAVCDLAEDSALFPRKCMRYVQMGLREPLLRSLDPWLCYYCGDCAQTCPRQTEPGESMMTLRRWLTAQYDWTGISSRLYTSVAWQLGALAAAAALVAGLLQALVFHWDAPLTHVALNTFAPARAVHTFDLTVATLLTALLGTYVLRMFWLTVYRGGTAQVPLASFIEEAQILVLHGATQKQFLECAEPGRWFESRWIKHFLLVSGYAIMFALVVVFLEWFQTDTVHPFWHPQRLLGYYAAAVLVVFLSEALWGRIMKKEQMHKFTDLSDWAFPVLLWLTAVTGIIVHVSRIGGFPQATYAAYAVHLVVAITMLITVYPFGKWSHVVYRPLAMYFHAVKKNALRRQPQPVG
ncbi:MAG: 4Fe-4S dicluster domain-containing protein [Elusimicrobia bacterium]|nr:4Fe-4S dicluster domain-containing protein [Elusimicrobiota bacterium]